MGRALPFALNVIQPCHEDWQSMQGGHRERHCASCNRRVQNFAAMTVQEIEHVVLTTGGNLCGRLIRRGDGTLVTLHSPGKTLPAGVALGVALAAGATTRAQQPDSPVQATLSGTLRLQGGEAFAHGPVMIWIRSAEKTAALARADENGRFTVTVQPGTYDVRITGVGDNVVIPSAVLHAGEQNVDILVRQQTETVTVGGVSVVRHSNLGLALRHPIAFLQFIWRSRKYK